MNAWYGLLNFLRKTLSCEHSNNHTQTYQSPFIKIQSSTLKNHLREETFAEKPLCVRMLYATLTRYSFIESNGATLLIVTFVFVLVSVKVPLKYTRTV